jgi:hypothetical protein
MRRLSEKVATNFALLTELTTPLPLRHQLA